MFHPINVITLHQIVVTKFPMRMIFSPHFTVACSNVTHFFLTLLIKRWLFCASFASHEIIKNSLRDFLFFRVEWRQAVWELKKVFSRFAHEKKKFIMILWKTTTETKLINLLNARENKQQRQKKFKAHLNANIFFLSTKNEKNRYVNVSSSEKSLEHDST